jgi:hypothetical protein
MNRKGANKSNGPSWRSGCVPELQQSSSAIGLDKPEAINTSPVDVKKYASDS